MRARGIAPKVYEIEILNASEKDLKEINESLGLALSLEEMKKLQEFFVSLRRNPTDIEIHAIAQGWSEHCSYKSSKPVLRKYIFGIPSKHALIVMQDDAGVVEFNEDYAYVFKIESHNHPSAVEPYGGAATGVGGIIRDVLNMGAKPIALVDPLFFGPPDYPYEKLNPGIKHPLYLMQGVIAGIRDYGNRVGIPTVAGITYFHEDFVNNILVNAGCLGIVRKDKIVRSVVSKAGLKFVLMGGRTGRDGIHGVNFASKILSEKSEEERQAVQLGNPIIKEPLIHAILEANDAGIIKGMKDLGGGGLGSVIGEMCHTGGVGAEVHLDKVLLKEKDMAPWEIWVSESQERMLLAVEEKDIEKLREICDKWDIEMSIIGQSVEGDYLDIYWYGKRIVHLPLEFVTAGVEYERPYKIKKIEKMQEIPTEPNYRNVLLSLLSSYNIGSKEWIIRQYDHEVQGRTVLKPLQGIINHETHGDAAIIKPLKDSWKGLAITTVANPQMGKIDAYQSALYTVDEAIRNLVAVGARPHSFSDGLNFGNPEREEIMGEFHEACRGLGDAARFLGIPYVSGNVSFYNEAFGKNIPPTPVLMAVGIIGDIRKAISTDFKKEGNSIYLVGETKEEMGGSEYYKLIGAKSTIVPKVNLKELKDRMEEILKAMNENLIASCHDVSHGGLAVALAEMSIGGKMGAEIDLSSMGFMRADFKLFSESPTRWICEVKKEEEEEFEKIVKARKIGLVGGENLKIRDGNRWLFNIHTNILRESWRSALKDYLG
ncbi:phosphoribosylformylglycinamidine synthase subunit PurL [Candidatus Aciduliprofundum boonei]|uniref:Phosphoribosylformylglycinamidine synthase subunit PurL n=1 Tax=Aciduliprofundum boonei (strain DSM 19572 / T469) TaxID=439481 RepID=D3T9E2_ACIB4|nr:phosphoribosylformylglycinamidine synthase subunit PurL [Candidatus Aciduliprofundum boonei]ADD08721.1 phosphoribosylformylglycinamidine synthase II [Aciduliprofundum boonei T469]HII54904.1 phosphoribosylformylglycinamidine synthase subunit PurL [Candidatus Aciduliprofundum boonei]